MLLEAEAQDRVRQREKKVVIGIEGITIARKAAREEFQLIISRAGRHDGTVVELRLNEGGNRCYLVMRATDEDIEIGINHQLAIHGQSVQQPFYIFLGDAVGRVGHGAVALRLALQLPHEFALGRYLDDLIVDDTIGIRYLRQEGEEVGGNVSTIDIDREERSHEVGHIDFVYIHQWKRLHRPVANLQVLIGALEIGHGEWPLLELECHEAVEVFVYLRLAQLAVGDTFLL